MVKFSKGKKFLKKLSHNRFTTGTRTLAMRNKNFPSSGGGREEAAVRTGPSEDDDDTDDDDSTDDDDDDGGTPGDPFHRGVGTQRTILLFKCYSYMCKTHANLRAKHTLCRTCVCGCVRVCRRRCFAHFFVLSPVIIIYLL